METTLRSNPASPALPSSTNAAAQGSVKNTALTVVRTKSPVDVVEVADSAVTKQATRLVGHAPARRSPPHFDTRLQGDVASAQQAQDYLERVASQLESVKAALSAKIAGMKSGARDLEARARQLSASIAARTQQAGGSVDANLDFSEGEPAQQRFRIQGLDADTLQASAPLSLSFSIGGAGGPQLTASIEPGMTKEEIAGRLDRTLAPLKVRAGMDRDGRIAFSTAESNWPGVRDSVAISGRGRVATEAMAPELKLEDLNKGNAEALRQSLREVVQALERVRRSQAAASAALSAASMRAVQPEISPEQLSMTAQDFASTAASHDYESLLQITSALVGVSRERVLSLLGLR